MTDTKHAAKQAPVGPETSPCGRVTQQMLLLVSKPGAGLCQLIPLIHEIFQASLDLHTNFQPNKTEGRMEEPHWEDHKHANRTRIHADKQRPEQRAKAESLPCGHLMRISATCLFCSPGSNRQAWKVFSISGFM